MGEDAATDAPHLIGPMAARDVFAGLGCLFQAVVILGYFASAWFFRSWVMLVAPFAGAGIVILWVIVRSRLDED